VVLLTSPGGVVVVVVDFGRRHGVVGEDVMFLTKQTSGREPVHGSYQAS
jgi:hypothetical protein